MHVARVDGVRERERGSFYCAAAARSAHGAIAEAIARKKIRDA
jgi:hypothetical protein